MPCACRGLHAAIVRVVKPTTRVTAAAGRRLLAEFTGTGPLVAVIVGSGIAVTRLTGDGALRLLASATVTALGLAVLITVLAPLCSAHFNPLVTAADWLLARRGPGRSGRAWPPR
jgi:glycerol uptake facilitator-like aquaporin